MGNIVQGLTSHERLMPPQGLHVAQHDFAAVSTIQESPVPSDFAVARLDQLAQMSSSATAWYLVKNGFALETLGPVAPASRTPSPCESDKGTSKHESQRCRSR
jgi:hypothetical protein